MFVIIYVFTNNYYIGLYILGGWGLALCGVDGWMGRWVDGWAGWPAG